MTVYYVLYDLVVVLIVAMLLLLRPPPPPGCCRRVLMEVEYSLSFCRYTWPAYQYSGFLPRLTILR